MAIFIYIGVPGSGKSYEVVSSVIVPAYCKGRRIVTNIYGLDSDKIQSYCINKKLADENTDFGEIISISNERVLEPDFYPVRDSSTSFCKPGDLVILDECHRFYSTDKSLSSDAKIFAAEHRHYADEKTGVTCDLVLINQGLSTLPRFLRERVDSVFRMKKLNSLPFSSKRYRVDVFDSTKLTLSSRITFYVKEYDKDVYPLYKSHDVKGAIELEVDGRGKLFRFHHIFLFLFIVIGSFYLIYAYLIPFFSSSDKVNTVTRTEHNDVALRTHLNSENNKETRPPFSERWCITGRIVSKDGAFVFLRDASGKLRMVSAKNFRGTDILLEGEVDGVHVVAWSCVRSFSGVIK